MTDEHEPQYTTESVEDLHELLVRASNWAAKVPTGKVVAAEIEQAAEFVADELLDGRQEVPADD